jgi:ketosteroid isomerase-like protein
MPQALPVLVALVLAALPLSLLEPAMRTPPTTSAPVSKALSSEGAAGSDVHAADSRAPGKELASDAAEQVDAAGAWAAERDVDRMERSAGVTEPTVAEQNAATMTSFYDAFSRHDGKAMAALYADDAVFHDEAFGTLHGAEIGAMWMMLTEASPTLKVRASKIRGDGTGASGHWDADYAFSATGRQVHNSIDARMTIKDGKISKHEDSFSFETWALQALPAFDKLGWLGRKMAGSGLVQGLLKHTARKSLWDYLDKHGIERP